MASAVGHLLVAAIDFGTTYSGYAFSSLDDYKRDPLKVCANTWNAGSGGLISLKTSTCVLFKPDGEFHSFGYEAEDKYSDLALDEEHTGWHYFRRFKMKLYENKFLNRHFLLEDDQGAKMPAMTIFSSVIKYLKDHMMDTCRKQLVNIEDSDILWVLTVPAIWSDASKQFMREAAVNAGIGGCHLAIALEPEAASLYCKYLPMEKSKEAAWMSPFSAGSKYLVLDAGGGTIDITVHEVQRNGSLKEITKANGDDWGGTKVDWAYQILLSRIIGNGAFNDFCTSHKADMIELFRDFEIKKRAVKPIPGVDDKVTFKIPMAMNECCRENNAGRDIATIIRSSPKFKEGLSVTGDKLRTTGHLAKDLFKDPVKHITDILKTLMRNPVVAGIKTIMLVGGFSESLVLQNEVRQCFPNLKLIVPPDAGLAVLKGAVIFGHEPRIITTRVCKYTYGIKTTAEFEPGLHDPSKLYTTTYGEDRCRDIFNIHASIGDSLDIGQPQSEEEYSVTEPDQERIRLEVYISTQHDTMYITDPGCIKIGELCIGMVDTSRGLDRGVDVQMTFGNTELEVEATDYLTGEIVTAAFDFLK